MRTNMGIALNKNMLWPEDDGKKSKTIEISNLSVIKEADYMDNSQAKLKTVERLGDDSFPDNEM